ncbi:MAG: TlpA family protein disulfide reductase [Planctomycetes bacterium]|nr:TlpA family protein disulfide reductase [Planctomycetota bacterium]
MKSTTRWITALLAMAFLMQAPTTVVAQETQDEIKAELAAVRKELAALRADMKQVLVQLKTMKTASARKPKPRRRPALDLLGKPAPEKSFVTTDNTERKLGGKSDKVKMVCFYASWCGYCKRTLPKFQKLHEQYEGKDVEFMAISLDERTGKRKKTEQQVMDHYAKMGIKMPLFLDGKKDIGRAYKVQSFPTSFVVGKDGVIEAVHVGGPADIDKQVAKEIDTLLAGKSLVKKSGAAKVKTQ